MIDYLYNFYQTSVHKLWVLWYLLKFCWVLIKRGIVHDFSKYTRYEEPYFRKNVRKLRNTTYGSEEYKEMLRSIKPAIQHHQQNNSHHPEFYPEGIDGMSLLDKIEMLADWKAAGRRHNDGNMTLSIRKNADRFQYDIFEEDSYYRSVEEAL